LFFVVVSFFVFFFLFWFDFLREMANLLSNAIKHSPAGETVGVSLEPGAQTVRVRVRDRGPGIDPAFRSRMFHQVFRRPTGPIIAPRAARASACTSAGCWSSAWADASASSLLRVAAPPSRWNCRAPMRRPRGSCQRCSSSTPTSIQGSASPPGSSRCAKSTPWQPSPKPRRPHGATRHPPWSPIRVPRARPTRSARPAPIGGRGPDHPLQRLGGRSVCAKHGGGLVAQVRDRPGRADRGRARCDRRGAQRQGNLTVSAKGRPERELRLLGGCGGR